MLNNTFWSFVTWLTFTASISTLGAKDGNIRNTNTGSSALENTISDVIGNQPQNFESLCIQSLIVSTSAFKLHTLNGKITVHCLWNAEGINQTISLFYYVNRILRTTAELVGATNKSLAYLQRDSFVSICLLNCHSGYPYHRFNFLTSSGIEEPIRLNIGCDDLANMKCKERCPSPVSMVDNGVVTCTEGTFDGSSCNLHCDAGYASRGAIEKTCNASLSVWLPNTPYICDATCPLQALMSENARVQCTDSTFIGSVCKLQCDEGHEPRGPIEKRCVGGQNTWSPHEPFRCVAVTNVSTCETLFQPENAEMECTRNNSLFSKCTMTCNIGYNPREPIDHWCFPDQTGEKSSWYILGMGNLPRRVIPAEVMTCTEIATLARATPFETAVFENSGSPVQLKRLGSCRIPMNNRRPCGSIHITFLECERRSCCWDIFNLLWFRCFRSYKRPRTIHSSSPSITGNFLPTQYSNFRARTMQAAIALEEFETYIGASEPHSLPGSKTTGRQNNQRTCGCKEQTYSTARLCSDLDNSFQTPNSIRSVGRKPVTRISHSLCGDASTTAAHWPWHAVVYFNEQLCGGTLIAPQYVVTAAHCLFPNDGSQDNVTTQKFVGLGSTNLSDNADPRLQIRTIQTIIRHPNYTNVAGYARNDIAILKINRPVDVSGVYVRPLCLPNNRIPMVSDECFATGFGQEDQEISEPATLLQAVRLPLIPKFLCQRYYQGFEIDAPYICAGGTRPGDSDTCRGDSGGPLACRKANSEGECHWYLAGITSFGRSKCGQGTPGVYTNVYNYQRWIRNTVFRLSQNFTN